MTSDEASARTAPFNMALSTLEKINKILVDIKKASVYGLQGEKYNLVLQFHIQSIPLISKKEGKEKMQSLKGTLRDIRPGQRKVLVQGVFNRMESCFNRDVDFALDDVLEEIQVLLQSEGYFMPPSEEEDLY